MSVCPNYYFSVPLYFLLINLTLLRILVRFLNSWSSPICIYLPFAIYEVRRKSNKIVFYFFFFITAQDCIHIFRSRAWIFPTLSYYDIYTPNSHPYLFTDCSRYMGYAVQFPDFPKYGQRNFFLNYLLSFRNPCSSQIPLPLSLRNIPLATVNKTPICWPKIFSVFG